MILIVGSDEPEKARLATILREAKVEAFVPKDLAEAHSTLRDKPIRVIWVCAGALDETVLTLVKNLDQRRAQRACPIVVVTEELTDEALTRAVQAGVDGEMRRRRGRDYVVCHATAMHRLARRPPSELLITEAKPAAAGAPASSPLEAATRAKPWAAAKEMLRVAAGEFLTVPASLASTTLAESEISAACHILMGNATDKLELRIALGSDAKSVKHLAVHLFGDEGEEMGAELLSELTNVFMGTLKTAFSDEGVKFAAGLPEVVPPQRVLHPAEMYSVQQSFEYQFADARVVVYVGLRGSGTTTVNVLGLREGMVLSKDLFNQKGLMLVRGGTRLSLNMVEKLRTILTSKEQVEVLAT